MSEFVTEDGELIDDQEPTDPQSPYGLALRKLAAFKFKLYETVAADPKLRKAPCTEAIIAYARCVTIDKRTLKPTPAYASAITLMARGNMRSKTTARLSRNLLQQEGYLVPTGSATKDGCVRYQLANPRAEQVSMHVREAEEYLAQIDATRKEDERRKKKAKEGHGEQYAVPPEDDRGVNNWPDRGSNIDPNYLGENLSGLGSEEGATPIKVSSAPSGYEHEMEESLGFEGEGYTLREAVLTGHHAVDPVGARALIDEDEIVFARDAPTAPPDVIEARRKLKSLRADPSGYSSATAKADEGDYVFALPADEADADAMLASILEGMTVLPAVEAFFRKQLIAGTLKKSMIDHWRQVA